MIRKESNQYSKICDDAKEKLCKSDHERKMTSCKILDDEAKEKLCQRDQKRRQIICDNLGDEVKEKLGKNDKRKTSNLQKSGWWIQREITYSCKENNGNKLWKQEGK